MGLTSSNQNWKLSFKKKKHVREECIIYMYSTQLKLLVHVFKPLIAHFFRNLSRISKENHLPTI